LSFALGLVNIAVSGMDPKGAFRCGVGLSTATFQVSPKIAFDNVSRTDIAIGGWHWILAETSPSSNATKGRKTMVGGVPSGADISKDLMHSAKRMQFFGPIALWIWGLVLGTLSIMAMPLVSAQTVQTSPSDMLWSVLITFTIAMICVAYGMMLALMPESRSGVVTLFIVYSTAVVAPIFGAMMVDVVWGSTAGAIAVFAFLFLSAPITYLASFGVRSSERLLMETLDPPSKDVPGVYRKLLADLLVRIMTCDTGKINAKERHHFIQVMHDMGMKQWMAQALIRQLDDPWQTWQDVVTEVIERGEELGQSTPDHILMERLVAAAKSDGVLNEEERAFLEMVGHQLGWTGDDVEDALLL